MNRVKTLQSRTTSKDLLHRLTFMLMIQKRHCWRLEDAAVFREYQTVHVKGFELTRVQRINRESHPPSYSDVYHEWSAGRQYEYLLYMISNRECGVKPENYSARRVLGGSSGR